MRLLFLESCKGVLWVDSEGMCGCKGREGSVDGDVFALGEYERKDNHMVEGTSVKDLSQWVADTLGRAPRDISLYKEAMRHRSYAHEKGLVSNGRLAYLGDAILKSILSELLYCQVPAMDEGRMSTLRSEVENGKKLSYWADKLSLPICATTPCKSYGEYEGGGDGGFYWGFLFG